MPVLIIPNQFVNGTVADADPVNDNFNAVANVVNSIDNTNIGPPGIYASQIKPTSNATSTFGGQMGYTFEAYTANIVPLTVSGAPSQAVDFFRVVQEDGTKLLWVAADFSVNTHGALNVGGDLAVAGDLAVDTLTITSNTLTLSDLETTNLLLADNELRVHGNAFFTADVDMSGDLSVPQIDLGLDGYLRFGMGYMLTQHATNMSLSAGAIRLPGGSSWQAQAAAANIVQPTSTTAGTKFYSDAGLTSGNNYTPTLVASFDAGGLAIDGVQSEGTRIRFDYGNACIGVAPNGSLYIGAGFHYNVAQGAFIADATECVGIFLGTRAGSPNRFELFYNAQDVGDTFVPNIVATLGTGSNNQFIANGGMIVRSGGAVSGTAPTLFGGNGIPPASLGGEGDFWFNNGAGASGYHIYYKHGGAWVILV